jgi:hypothetical protein
MKAKWILPMVLSIALFSCEKELGLGLHDDEKMAIQLKNAPEDLRLDGINLDLSAYLWRDFMPPSEPDGSPLMAVVELDAENGLLPDGIEPERLYVIYGNNIWATGFDEVTQGDDEIEVISRNGPKWGSDEEVEVVLMFNYDEKTYEIREDDVIIEGTY